MILLTRILSCKNSSTGHASKQTKIVYKKELIYNGCP